MDGIITAFCRDGFKEVDDMRIDKNFRVFGGRPEWYTFVPKQGYIPKEDAPEEAKKAMRKYNSYTFSDANKDQE